MPKFWRLLPNWINLYIYVPMTCILFCIPFGEKSSPSSRSRFPSTLFSLTHFVGVNTRGASLRIISAKNTIIRRRNDWEKRPNCKMFTRTVKSFKFQLFTNYDIIETPAFYIIYVSRALILTKHNDSVVKYWNNNILILFFYFVFH